jgi:hypothetical protein
MCLLHKSGIAFGTGAAICEMLASNAILFPAKQSITKLTDKIKEAGAIRL